ncbi:MAG: hypothetical protein HOP08_02690 [Cyclobacteriaceae bacterium]|nr:hypothetical protein [Cyclobacteriaceae bacterium]
MNNVIDSKEIESIIEWSDLEKIWTHLEKVYSLNTLPYREGFKKYLENMAGDAQPKFFVGYGELVIEPTLNEILKRDSSYPTWNYLLRFLLKIKLSQNPEQRNFYLAGVWKKRSFNTLNNSSSYHLMA